MWWKWEEGHFGLDLGGECKRGEKKKNKRRQESRRGCVTLCIGLDKRGEVEFCPTKMYIHQEAQKEIVLGKVFVDVIKVNHTR